MPPAPRRRPSRYFPASRPSAASGGPADAGAPTTPAAPAIIARQPEHSPACRATSARRALSSVPLTYAMSVCSSRHPTPFSILPGGGMLTDPAIVGQIEAVLQASSLRVDRAAFTRYVAERLKGRAPAA